MPDPGYPLQPFNFQVDFTTVNLTDNTEGDDVPLCGGAFSEVTGLEATMEPKVIKEGGRNYGPAQRVGQVTFATVILKRGMTNVRDLWKWFDLVAAGGSAKRLTATVTMNDEFGVAIVSWKLHRALPIKFKAADLNATATNVAIEELHIAHEGLELLEEESEAASRELGDFNTPTDGETGVA